jgi:hypothetical protein
MDLPWDGLGTKGFVVVRQFVPERELEFLRAQYAAAGSGSLANGNYAIRPVSLEAIGRLEPLLRTTTVQVARRTGIVADFTSGAVHFATESMEFGWHQDHESFFLLQEHHHYLNFYIPIIKPDPALSNMSVIPFDSLRARAPQAYARLAGGGACSLTVKNGRTIVRDDENGGAFIIDLDVGDLAQTPQLGAGDLLLMRGDVIHRTQDTTTRRVAISLRRQSSVTTVSRQRMLAGCAGKKEMMRRNPRQYQLALRCFAEHGKDELPAGRLYAYVMEHTLAIANGRESELSLRQFSLG